MHFMLVFLFCFFLLYFNLHSDATDIEFADLKLAALHCVVNALEQWWTRGHGRVSVA